MTTRVHYRLFGIEPSHHPQVAAHKYTNMLFLKRAGTIYAGLNFLSYHNMSKYDAQQRAWVTNHLYNPQEYALSTLSS